MLINLLTLVCASLKTYTNMGKANQFKTEEKRQNFLNKLKVLCNGIRTDKQIGEILGKNHRTIGYHRKLLGLQASMPERTYHTLIDKIKGYMIRNSKWSAKRRNHEFNLNIEDIQLPEYCPLLGIKLYYNFEKRTHFNSYNHASLDRIDNSKGYIKGNIIVLSRLANAMKNEADFDQLLTFSDNIKSLINHFKNQGALGNITDVFPNITLKT